MARKMNRLTAKSIAAAKQRGYYADGGNLYLQVSEWGTKSWIFRYMRSGKSTDLGLGPIHTIRLAEARDRATDYRKLLLDGIDPKDWRDSQRQQHALEAAKSVRFRDYAESYITAQRPTWKSEKHAAQWGSTLATYAYPVIGDLPLQKIDTALVLRVLVPIWTQKPETASRLRQRIEKILAAATIDEYRSGDNPARLKGHLEHRLPKISKEQRVEHHPALPYQQIAAFISELREQQGSAARALQLTVLTAARTDAVIRARAEEFDLRHGVWTIPGERMKGKKRAPHKVPLSASALDLVREQIALSQDYVFPGMRKGEHLSNASMLAVLKRMHAANVSAGGAGWRGPSGRMAVPHGFRSTFKDWAAECTHFPNIVSEMALAHGIGDKVEAAYRRGELMDKRKQLMNAWAKFCNTVSVTAEVVPLRHAS